MSVDKLISTIELSVLSIFLNSDHSMTIHEQKKNGLAAATTDSAAVVGLHAQAGYITLKEASERFGYAPDYIGQLIRKGKIEGKQVYANVAWVTTEEAMEAYKTEAEEKRATKAETPSPKFSFAVFVSELSAKLFSPRMTQVFTFFLGLVAILLVLALIVAFYLISVSFDRSLSDRATERLEISEENGTLAPTLHMSYQGNAPFRI